MALARIWKGGSPADTDSLGVAPADVVRPGGRLRLLTGP
jgi:hypothetical protein